MDINKQSQEAQAFCDKDMMTDLLTSQKHITGGYNSYANECATPALKTDMMNILNDEHTIQNDVFCEMQKRGWYPTEAAEQTKINQVKQTFQNLSMS